MSKALLHEELYNYFKQVRSCTGEQFFHAFKGRTNRKDALYLLVKSGEITVNGSMLYFVGKGIRGSVVGERLGKLENKVPPPPQIAPCAEFKKPSQLAAKARRDARPKTSKLEGQILKKIAKAKAKAKAKADKIAKLRNLAF